MAETSAPKTKKQKLNIDAKSPEGPPKKKQKTRNDDQSKASAKAIQKLAATELAVPMLDSRNGEESIDQGTDEDTAWSGKADALQTWMKGRGGKMPQRKDETHCNKRANRAESVLARWVKNQRKAYKNKKMPKWKVQWLECIPGWAWDAQLDGWARQHSQVKKWMENNKVLPSRRASDDAESALGAWVKRQHDEYAGTTGILTRERLERLLEIPCWRFPIPVVGWTTMFAALRKSCRSKAEIPTAAVHARTKARWLPIGQWYAAQVGTATDDYRHGTNGQMRDFNEWRRSLPET